MDPLGPGRIFWQIYPGTRGDGKKRPMIVTTPRMEIARTRKIFAVVCSTQFADPIDPELEVELPFREDGKGCTKLREQTVAVCDWTVVFDLADIKETAGLVSGHILKEICRLAQITYPSER